MRIDGKKIAENIFKKLKKEVEKLKSKNIMPYMAIILVGNDPASKAYVNRKVIKTKEIGAEASVYHLNPDVSTKDLLLLLKNLNDNSLIHGIIVQRPLPPQVNINIINSSTKKEKDIDAFHPKTKFLVPIVCAVFKILEEIFRMQKIKNLKFDKWLKKQNIIIIGKGETGGGPIISAFKKMCIEPNIIDSKTQNPETLMKNADIIISAVGKLNVLNQKMLKKEVILISIGLHKGEDGKMHGDYDEEKIKDIASFYTPTPGGVGPVNVACLLENFIKAAENLTK